jgi:hypothetical protein
MAGERIRWKKNTRNIYAGVGKIKEKKQKTAGVNMVNKERKKDRRKVWEK